MIQYQSREIESFHVIERALIKGLDKLKAIE